MVTGPQSKNMATVFQIPATEPFAKFVNDKIAFTQRETIAYQYDQMLKSYMGDPAVGGMAATTNIPWNKTSETQSLIVEYYATQGEQADPLHPQYPPDMQAILEKYVGPKEKWNYSYEQWGLVPGVPGIIAVLDTAEVATGRAVRVIDPR